MQQEKPDSLNQKVKDIPRKPGVYLFKNTSNEIIYIGKASCLKDRVSSYFHSNHSDSPKTAYMVTKIADVEFITTGNEAEALLLESNLVKKNKPKFNIDLKDDKSYPFIKITIKDEYPTAFITREKKKEEDSLYYGPYVNAGSARYALQLMRKHLLIRSCTVPLSRIKRPCLMFHIHRCLGPCRPGTVDPIKYAGIIKDVRMLLEGKNAQLKSSLKEKMDQASTELRFEQAASYRDFIRTLGEMELDQKMVMGTFFEEDILGWHYGEESIVAQIFHIRKGLMLGRKEFVFRRNSDIAAPELLRSLICQYYLDELIIPPILLANPEPEDKQDIEKIVSEKRGAGFKIIQPKSGRRKKLLDLAMENARLSYETLHSRDDDSIAVHDLQKTLSLDILPDHIEAFDISTLQGTSTVASLVVFRKGRPDKSSYRKFKIKTVEGVDDYASMREVVERRYKRILEENGAMPDLVLIDGGPGQLSAAQEALDKVGVFDQPVISLAKKEELVYTTQGGEPLRLPGNSPALKLMQRVRDEAHRFAVTFQRSARKKKAIKSSLEDIPGIGPAYRKKLLTAFGSIENIKNATIEKLADAVGEKHAKIIDDYFKKLNKVH
jgi:excinuclease ABC subunit C